MRRTSSLLAAVAVTAASILTGPAGLPSATAHGRPSPPPTGVSWGACTDEFLVEIGAQCGSLDVPLDYQHPRRGTVTLALSRLQHTSSPADYRGIMLVNPGGPGGSGLEYSFLGLLMPDDVLASYDWIGFDPRGVGASEPALRCDPDYFNGPRPDYDVGLSRTLRAWIHLSMDYARACAGAGELLDHLTTVDNARDMDSIRVALGARSLNFYGFSYGTYLAQVYATLFPRRTGRMVLDANVDPRRVWYGANLDQDVAFETVIDLFFAWVAKYDDVYGLGATADDVEKAYYAERAALTANPIGTLGPDELTDAMLLPGYVQALWPDLAQALSDLVVDGDAAAMTGWYEAFDGPGDDNGFAMYLATSCTDAPWPSLGRLLEDSAAIDRKHPFFTWGNAWFNAPCSWWQGDARQPVWVHGGQPLLLIDETLDAATPFPGSLEVRRRFEHSVLIAVDGGTTHANSLAGNPCVDEPIFAYLRDGSLPARDGDGVGGSDVTCLPLPEPTPATAASAAMTGGGAHRLLSSPTWSRHLGAAVARP
jgi:pimeloyl-ACP methyl ester carboxylesterase